jgi:long-subunit acyl-CoA synthetase (AMP-forming)
LTNITSVTLYDTLGSESIEFIFLQTQLSTVVASAEKVMSLLDIKKKSGKLSDFKAIIHFDEVNDEIKSLASEVGITLVKY